MHLQMTSIDGHNRNDDFNGHIFIDQLLTIRKQLNVAIMCLKLSCCVE
jgi:hypothetical protein